MVKIPEMQNVTPMPPVKPTKKKRTRQRMSDKDKDMIKAMSVIKKYCSERDKCMNCPMWDNCDTDQMPSYWYIPEETENE